MPQSFCSVWLWFIFITYNHILRNARKVERMLQARLRLRDRQQDIIADMDDEAPEETMEELDTLWESLSEDEDKK